MGKRAKRLCAFRLREEVWFEIQERAEREGVTQAEVIESAITGVVGEQAEFAPLVGGEEESEAPFHPLCRHCGEEFGAWKRGANTCSGCKSEGHGGEPRNCGVCSEIQGAF